MLAAVSGKALATDTTLSSPTATPQTIAASGDTFTITGTGAITVSGANAVTATNGAASFNNAGTVTVSGGSGAALEVGTSVSPADIVDVTNSGAMSTANFNTVYIHGKLTGTFLNTSTGTITSGADDTVRIHGAAVSFTNAGTITNTSTFLDDAVQFDSTVVTFANTGTIEATSGWGVVFTGGMSSATNSGRIIQHGTATTKAAVNPQGAGGAFTNEATGFISGANGLVYASSATVATVINAGTIEATVPGALAIGLTNNNDTLTLVTGSTTTGLVDGKGSGDSDTLIFDGATTGSFAINQLVNFEHISKQGAGAWSLSGDNAASMDALVNTGRLSINGDMHNTPITVLGAGILGGNGTVGAVDVHAGGHVAPGNSVGTLHTGAIVFADDSAYDVEIEGGAADRIVAAGTAFIGSNVTLNVTGTATSCGNLSLPILTSTALTGTFSLSTLLSNVSLSYDATTAYLDVSNGVGRVFTGFTNTPNQASTAAALDAMGCANQPYSAELAVLSDAEVPAAMDALSGAGQAGVAGALVEASQALPQAINRRIEQAFAALDTRGVVSAYEEGPMLLEQIEGVTVWGAGYGGLAAQAGNGNATGWRSGASGFVLGADGKVNEDVRLGVLGSIGITGIGAQALSGSSTDVSGGVYGGARLGVVTVKAGAAYTRHLIQTSRSIVFPGVNDTVTASYAAGTAQVYAELSRNFDINGMTLTPFARVNAVNHATDAFTETGGQGQLHTAASVVNALFVTLGVAGEDRFVLGDRLLVTARGSLGWRHAFGGGIDIANSFAGSGPFSLNGTAVASDAAMLEASGVFDINEGTSLALGYSGLLGSGLASGAVTATLAGRF
jgi:uncharacterized protein with beta-barrel porin domain